MTINRYIPIHHTASGFIPLVTDLSIGELAINTADGKAYTTDGSNIVQIGGGAQLSSSYALTASYAANAGNSPVSASYAVTASYAANAGNSPVSASYALTASYAANAGGASVSASYASTASMVNLAVVQVTGSYTASINDAFIFVNASAGSASVYLPGAAGRRGQNIAVYKMDSTANPVIVAAAGADVIDQGYPGRQFIVQGDSAAFVSDGGSLWASDGAITTGFNFVSASYAVTASYSKVAQTLLGSITSASYALTASYAANAGTGGTSGNPVLTSQGVTTPNSGTIELFASNYAGVVLPTFADVSGTVLPFARHPGYVQMIRGVAANNTLTDDLGTPATIGSVNYFSATGSAPQPRNSYGRLNLASSNTANTCGGWVQHESRVCMAYGFQTVQTFTIDNLSNSSARFFIGLRNSTSAAGLLITSSVNGVTGPAEPSTNATASSCIGILKDSTDTNFQIVSADNAVCNKRDGGATLTTSNIYQLTISKNTSDNTVGVLLEDITAIGGPATVLYNKVLTVNLPVSSSMMALQYGAGTTSINFQSVSPIWHQIEIWR